jgi:hypothetical protein
MLNIGPLYVTLVKYPHRHFLPIVEKGWSHEIDEPFRKGSCLVIRIPFTRPGIGIGVWGAPQDEEDALTSAIWGRTLDIPVDQLLEWD